jgi:hypothetical protein
MNTNTQIDFVTLALKVKRFQESESNCRLQQPTTHALTIFK